MQDQVYDLEDLHEGIDITDLGLNDFRIDLSNFIKNYGALKQIPEGIHGIVPTTQHLPPGVILVLKNINEAVNINKLNRLHPFYLVYIDMTGKVSINHIQSKKILNAMRLLCKGVTAPIAYLCEQINQETAEYQKMDTYSALLKQAIGSILETEEDKTVQTLFRAGGTHTESGSFKGIEDFKLISFLIVK